MSLTVQQTQVSSFFTQYPDRLPVVPDGFLSKNPEMRPWATAQDNWYYDFKNTLDRDRKALYDLAGGSSAVHATGGSDSFENLSGLVKVNSNGELVDAIEGIDYQAPGDYILPGRITTSGLTANPNRLIGRSGPNSGNVEEIQVGRGLRLVDGLLTMNAETLDDLIITQDGHTVSIETERVARITADGFLEGKYTLTVTAGSVVTGMNITSSTGLGTDISSVTFQTDKFLIYNGTSGQQMFYVSGSSVLLANTLKVNTSGKVFIGTGTYANTNTAFYVDSTGQFSLKDKLTWDGTTLTITGSLTATTGAIGGFNIGADYIRDAANSMGMASTVTGGDDVRFWAGDTFANRASAPFMVTEAGNITATNATITGTISGRSTATIASSINSSGNLVTDLINARLDSSAKTILADFNFGSTDYAGAVKSGTIAWNSTTGAITGGSGVVVYRGGIVGASGGVATFTIDATTGSATFGGTLSAPLGNIGGFTIGATTLTGGTLVLNSSTPSITLGSATMTSTGFKFGSATEFVTLKTSGGFASLSLTAGGTADLAYISATSTSGKLHLGTYGGGTTYLEWLDGVLFLGASAGVGASLFSVAANELTVPTTLKIGNSDTNLYRSAADRLKTDDRFFAALGAYGPNSIRFYSPNEDGSTNDLTNLDSMITAVDAGSDVFLTAGKTYRITGPWIINKKVRIVGYGAKIQCATDALNNSSFSSLIRLTADGCVVEGLELDCNGSSDTLALDAGTGIKVQCNDAKILNCIIFNSRGVAIDAIGDRCRGLVQGCTIYNCFTGMYLDDSGGSQPTYWRIVNNHIRDGQAATTALSGGIKISGTGSLTSVAGHIIVGNNIELPGEVGIELQTWVNDCIVDSNRIYCEGICLSFAQCARNSATGNHAQISGSGSYGICYESSGDGSHQNEWNSFTGNQAYGYNRAGSQVGGIGYSISEDQLYTTITGGVVDGFDTAGVFIQGSTGADAVTVSGVTFTRCFVPVTVAKSSNWKVHGCSMDSGNGVSYCYMTLDTTDGVVSNWEFTDNSLYGGDTQNCAIQFYIPGSNVVSDGLIANNNSSGFTGGSTDFFNNSGGSGAQYVDRIKCHNNLFNRTSGSYNEVAPHYTGVTRTTNLSNEYAYWIYDGQVIYFDCSGGNKTCDLPAIADVPPDFSVTIEKSEGGANKITVNSAQQINGKNAAGTSVFVTSYDITTEHGLLEVRATNGYWSIIRAR